MTAEEAIKIIEIAIAEVEWEYPMEYAVAFETAIEALEEVEQYRALGTVEELKEAKEKQIPKKPHFVDIRFRNHGRNISDGCSLSKCYKCHNCGLHIFNVFNEEHCKHCGQAIDWSEGE